MTKWFLKKANFNAQMYVTFGQARNDIDLQYSHTFINANSCLHLLIFRSQAVILSEKFTVFTFFCRKP